MLRRLLARLSRLQQQKAPTTTKKRRRRLPKARTFGRRRRTKSPMPPMQPPLPPTPPQQPKVRHHHQQQQSHKKPKANYALYFSDCRFFFWFRAKIFGCCSSEFLAVFPQNFHRVFTRQNKQTSAKDHTLAINIDKIKRLLRFLAAVVSPNWRVRGRENGACVRAQARVLVFFCTPFALYMRIFARTREHNNAHKC